MRFDPLGEGRREYCRAERISNWIVEMVISKKLIERDRELQANAPGVYG